MKFTATEIFGAYIIDIDPKSDPRGFFARAFDQAEFAEHSLVVHFPQTNMSFNHKAGTIRGLHYQEHPHAEAKLMRCISGKMFNVFVDLRPDSSSYMRWFGVELSGENSRTVYVPEGCANGYQALVDNTTALYSASTVYTPQAERGIRWNDPKFGIKWPITENVIVSDKDQSWPNFSKVK